MADKPHRAERSHAAVTDDAAKAKGLDGALRSLRVTAAARSTWARICRASTRSTAPAAVSETWWVLRSGPAAKPISGPSLYSLDHGNPARKPTGAPGLLECVTAWPAGS